MAKKTITRIQDEIKRRNNHCIEYLKDARQAFIQSQGNRRTFIVDSNLAHEVKVEEHNTVTTFRRFPIAFIENQGQVDRGAKFYLRTGSQTVWLTHDGIVFDLLRMKGRSQTVGVSYHTQPLGEKRKMTQHVGEWERLALIQDFIWANRSPVIEANAPQPGMYNYFLGNDPTKWCTGVQAYAEVIYREVWEGIDLKLYGNGHDLEQEFIVRPDGDLSQIRVAYRGIDRLWITEDGSLLIVTAFGELRESMPNIYQEINGQRVEVKGRFKLLGETAYTFEVAAYKPQYALVIDPTLNYATYLGGQRFDEGFGIAVDAPGNVYVTGRTASPDFPTNAGAFQPESGSGGGISTGFDAFVAKLNADGSTLIYSTYLGGSGQDEARGIAIDSAGNVYVTGCTTSADFPTANALQPDFGGPGGASALKGDAFVAKLNADGSALIYSTYLGGSGEDCGNGIAVDSAGNVYVTGCTTSADFPTANALQPDFEGPNPAPRGDAFVAKLNADGSALIYSTYLGGSGDDGGNGIAVDTEGNAYVTGFAGSADFPTTPGAFQTSGSGDAFVAKLNADGAALIYSTYLGGSNIDEGGGIAVDAASKAYVTGETSSADFPTVNALQPAFGGSEPTLSPRGDAFIAKLDAEGNDLIYSTYLGGSGSDEGNAIAVDSAGNAYVTGRTKSPDFPTNDPSQPTLGGGTLGDAFVAKLNADGSALLYSTYLGGTDSDEGRGIAVDAAGNIYVIGTTHSADFLTANPVQPDLRGPSDTFIAKIATGVPSAALSVVRIVANKGGDTGAVSVVVHGSAFALGATVKLVRSGQPDIIGDPVRVGEDGRAIATTFDLTGKARGIWDVVVTNPNGTSVILSDGFTIEEGRAAEVWVDIVGRARIRVGREQTFNILYGNRGNVDVLGVPLWITGIPKDATWEPGFEVIPPLPLEGQDPIDRSQVPIHVEMDNEVLLPLFVPQIPPGFTGVLNIKITIPTPRDFRLQAWVNPPFFQSPMSPDNVDCLLEGAKLALQVGLDLILPDDCVLELQRKLAESSLDTFLPDEVGRPNIGSVIKMLDQLDILLQYLEFGIACAGTVYPPAKIVDTAIDLIEWLSQGQTVLKTCSESPRRREFGVGAVSAVDPNEKVGSQGAEELNYLSGDEPLRYAIFFENLETSTAPAQEVVITDQLDVANMDLSTLSLGAIAFGDKRVNLPPGLRESTTDVDLRPANNLMVRVDARLDTVTGLLTWRLTSIDPATGQPPEDPLAGFLPPNVNAPEGQGNVLFTVMPEQGLPTGTEIRNQATIVFDVNPPITTPEWVNTLDNTKPTSQVHRLRRTRHRPHFKVKWSGTDDGAGIIDYTIFVSEDGVPFTVWRRNTTATSETFKGKRGKTYAFYSVARDRTGNLEDAPTVADATTRVRARKGKR